jgi:hypothetical protein
LRVGRFGELELFCDLIKGGLNSEADVFKSAVWRQRSGIEQNNRSWP